MPIHIEYAVTVQDKPGALGSGNHKTLKDLFAFIAYLLSSSEKPLTITITKKQR